MNNKELLRYIENAKYEGNSDTFQNILKRIKPFKSIKGDIKLKTLERFVFEMTKRYDFRPQWITFTSSTDKQHYTLALVRDSDNKWLGTVYGESIYELFVKFSLKIFYEIKVGNIKGVK